MLSLPRFALGALLPALPAGRAEAATAGPDCGFCEIVAVQPVAAAP